MGVYESHLIPKLKPGFFVASQSAISCLSVCLSVCLSNCPSVRLFVNLNSYLILELFFPPLGQHRLAGQAENVAGSGATAEVGLWLNTG